MKKEYTAFDLIAISIASMASLEADHIIKPLAILAGTLTWIETKNAVCDKLASYKKNKAENNSKLCTSSTDKFDLKDTRGLYYPKDLALAKVKRSNFSYEAIENYLSNHSA